MGPDLWNQTHNPWLSNPWYLERGTCNLAPATWSLGSDVWQLTPDTYNLEHDTWNQIVDPWLSNPWHLERGTWNLASDVWNLTSDTWNLTPGTWHLKPRTWHLTPGTCAPDSCVSNLPHRIFEKKNRIRITLPFRESRLFPFQYFSTAVQKFGCSTCLCVNA